ncbi:MAG TPA: hypothetical protein PK014_06640 [Thermoanaerobaculia bacterium]|nr:hypothetical protein [Thermoanaerobaculia bacterium]HUM29430.1 hypothetical protein [Thermoanaerobaculia bacterium]HXK67676.1 hypothetical protein [Thermoanaerobaculia bacterium]
MHIFPEETTGHWWCFSLTNFAECVFMLFRLSISKLRKTENSYTDGDTNNKTLLSMLALTVILISAPLFPQECMAPLVEYPLPEPYSDDLMSGCIVEGPYAYLLSRYHGLLILDIDNPTNPIVVSDASNVTQTTCSPYTMQYNDICLNDNILYITYFCNLYREFATGIVAVDVSNPYEPELVGSTLEILPVWFEDLEVFGDYLYVTMEETTTYFDLRIYDISAPSNIVMVNMLSDVGPSMTRSGSLLVTDSPDNTINFYDLSEPVNPNLITTYSMNEIFDLEIEHGRLYVSQPAGFVTIIDISDVDQPVYCSTIILSNRGSRMTVRNDKIFVQEYDASTFESEVKGFDVSDKSTPEFLASYHIINRLGGIAANNSQVYIASQGTLTILNAADCGQSELYIPAAASKQGAKDTNWKTDLVLHNPTDVSFTAHLTFLEAGQDNNSQTSLEISLPVSSSTKYTDILQSLFGVSNAVGGIKIVSPIKPTIISRTYNDQEEEGTYGQSIPALSKHSAVTSFISQRIVALIQNERYRSNLILLNISTTAADLNIELYNGTGAFIGSFSQHLLPLEYHQIDQFYAPYIDVPLDDGFIIISMLSPAAMVIAIASVVDNLTGDATTILSQN